MNKVGLLFDSVSDNTGDKAIGIVMEKFCRARGIEYEIAAPGAFCADDYSILIIGGGHILRDPGDPFYDAFRVRGRHVLNGAGLLTATDLEYLNEYEYVTVRSETERKMLEGTVRDVHVVPCVTVLMQGDETGLPRIRKESVGIQVTPAFLGSCPKGVKIIGGIRGHKYLTPVMDYAGDRELMKGLPWKSLPWNGKHELLDKLSPEQVFSVIGKMDYVIVSSLHATIFAYVQNVPFITMHQEKVYDFLKDRGLEDWAFRNSEELKDRIKKVQKSRPDFTELIEKDKAAAMAHLDRIEEVIRKRQR